MTTIIEISKSKNDVGILFACATKHLDLPRLRKCLENAQIQMNNLID